MKPKNPNNKSNGIRNGVKIINNQHPIINAIIIRNIANTSLIKSFITMLYKELLDYLYE